MSNTLPFVYDDGGRKAAGYTGSAGDCVTRAIAIATGLSYQKVYETMAAGNATQRKTKRSGSNTGRRTAAHGINVTRTWFKRFMESLGWTWTPTMHIGSGCKVHLCAGELPTGRLIVSVSKHYTTVIDGVVRDTHNPQREIATFNQFDGWREAPLKAGEMRNSNGIYTIARRCVYGYWTGPKVAS